MTLRRAGGGAVRVRRPVLWQPFYTEVASLEHGSKVGFDVLSPMMTTFPETGDLTVTRLIIDVCFGKAITGTNTAIPIISWGCIVVSLDAFNIGLTAMPDPSDDWDDDWLINQHTINPSSSEASLNNRTPPMDLRGQRKIDMRNRTLALIIRNLGISSAQDGFYSVTGNCLVKFQ